VAFCLWPFVQWPFVRVAFCPDPGSDWIYYVMGCGAPCSPMLFVDGVYRRVKWPIMRKYNTPLLQQKSTRLVAYRILQHWMQLNCWIHHSRGSHSEVGLALPKGEDKGWSKRSTYSFTGHITKLGAKGRSGLKWRGGQPILSPQGIGPLPRGEGGLPLLSAAGVDGSR